MNKENEFSRISDLFSLRSRFDDALSDPNYGHYINKIPKYDKNQFTNFSKCKYWSEVYNNLDKIKFNYDFEENTVNEILNMSLSFKEVNAFIFFFQLLAFFYAHTQNKNSFDDKNFIKITNAMICLNPYQTQAKPIYFEIYAFFANSIVLYFNNYYQYSAQQRICSAEVIKFYTSSIFPVYINIFTDFVMISKDISNNNEDSLLDLVLINAQTNQFSEKIILFIQPLCEKFNEKALNCLALLPSFPQTAQILKDLTNQIFQNAGEINIRFHQEDFSPFTQKEIEKFNFELIETESKFSEGFKSYIEFCDNESEFLIRILNKSVRKKIIALTNSLQFFQQTLVKEFLDSIIENFNNCEKNAEKFSLFIIFIVSCDKISKNSIVSEYSDFLFNSFIFNQNVTAFNTKPLDPILETIRSLVFSILSSNGSIGFEQTMSTISNPLFMAEFLCRIKNLKSCCNNDFVDLVVRTSCILRKLDIENHSENIEKARSSVFLVLSKIFLEMDDSYHFFEQIMQFCYEKSITSTFIYLFKETLRTKRIKHEFYEYYEFEPVYNFIDCSLKSNLEISWRFIEILSDFFYQFRQCPELTANIFDILINYLNANIDNNNDKENHTYEALNYVIEFVAYYSKLSAFHLSVISTFIRKFDSPDFYDKLVAKIGNVETQLVGKEGFFILHPIFLLIFALAYGFTNKALKLFNELIDFSLLNASYFHRFKIDSIILQCLIKSADSKFKYSEIEFEIEMGDFSKMKKILHKIMYVNSDFSIISIFLNDKKLLPELNYLLDSSLNDPRPVVPFGFFKPNYYCTKLNSSNFQKSFSLTFWILVDTIVEVKKMDINLITFECNNAKLRIFIQKSQIKISLETNRNITEVVLRQSISYQMKWRLFTLIFDSDTYLISTYIDNSELCQSKFVPIAFQSNSQVKLSVGGSTNSKYHHKICGYIGTISFYNRILSHNEIDHLFSIKTSTVDSSSIVASSSIFGDFTYIKNSYTNETVLSTLCNPSTIKKIFYLLSQEETEEGCYKYLSLIDSLAYAIPIEVLPIYNFITQESHFRYKKLYRIILSIFSHISLKFKNDDTSNSSKDSNSNNNNNSNDNSSSLSNLNLNLNFNLIRKSNKQELNLQQKWFRYIIVNIDIWINYSNFDEILYLWNSKLLANYQSLFCEAPFISTFLSKIEVFEKKNLPRNYWNSFFIFIERLSFIHLTSDEERVIFSMISELISKFQKLMTTDDYMKGTLQYCTLSHEIKRILRPHSNLESICSQVFEDTREAKSATSVTKKSRFKLKERIKKRFTRRRRKSMLDHKADTNQVKINSSMSIELSSIHDNLFNEEESDNAEEEVDEENESPNENGNENENENGNIIVDTDNSNSDNNDENDDDDDDDEENNTKNEEEEDANDGDDNNNDDNNNNDNNNNDNNNNDNNNNDNNNNDNKGEVEEFKKGNKIARLFKNKFFTKSRHKKRKSLDYSHRSFGLVGFLSKSEMERASNKLVYLLQFSHYTSCAKNSKNMSTNVDDDNDEGTTESSILVTQNSPRDGKSMTDLVHQIYYALQKESKHYYVIFPALRIKDETIASVALFGIHEIIPHSSVLKYTAEALRVIDPRIYDGIIKNLSKQIHMYPYLFPILCAMIIFNIKFKERKEKKNQQSSNFGLSTIFHDDEFILNLSKVYIGDNFEKWIFFPLILAFFVEERIAKEEILSVIVRSVSGNWDAILSVISLMTYIQDYFPTSDETLLIFYMLLTNYNYQDNKNLGDIFVQVCYSLFFIVVPTKIKEPSLFNFNNINDALKFVNQSYSSFYVKFFIRLENESIYYKGLKDLALSQINESISHFRFYNQDYIRNIIIVLNSFLHFNEIESSEMYSSLCKFIEKMRLDYKEQYTKHINSVFEKIKKSLNSKAFQDFTSEKFIISISNSKNSATFNIDDLINQDYQSMVSNKNNNNNNLQLDHFAQFGLKQKHSIDSNYRQCILEQISTSNPERKNELKEININCHVFKKDGEEAIPASFELKKGCISIKTEFKSFKIDRRDICGFKRENQAIEFITNEGKSFFVVFNDTEANKILRSKMTKKKTASRQVAYKMLQNKIENWKNYKITTFQLLMFINFYVGRTQKSLLKPCFPSMLSNDVHQNNENKFFEFSENLNVDDMDFDVDFADESEESNALINQMKSKNVVSAELYYFFESISKTEMIPNKLAIDRFEFVYKIRKMIEKTINIELWIDKVFHITIPHRNPIINQSNEIDNKSLFDKILKVQIKFASKIEDTDFVYKFIICSSEGQLFTITDQGIFEVPDQSVDVSTESKFFPLIDGIVIYNNKLHNLITVDKNGKSKTINNVYIDPSIASFTGSINRIVYLSTPTRINLVRELTFKGYLVVQKNSEKKKKNKSTTTKLDIEGNQQIHQLSSCVRILRASLNFNIIVTFSEDTAIRIMSLYDNKNINEFGLNGKEAIELLITKSFGFIFIATKLKGYLLTNNGSLIKKVRFDFSNVLSFFTFTSKSGIDYIGMVMKSGTNESKCVAFEAFYLDRINEKVFTFERIPHSLETLFDPISERIYSIDNNGILTSIKIQNIE